MTIGTIEPGPADVVAQGTTNVTSWDAPQHGRTILSWLAQRSFLTPERSSLAADAGRQATRLRFNPVMLLAAGQIALGLLIAAVTCLLVMHARDGTLTQADHEMRRLSLVLANQAERAFDAIDLVETSLLEQLQKQGVQTPEDFRQAMSGLEQHKNLSNLGRALPQLDALIATDADGNVINFSRYWPVPPINVADRDFFKALAADPERLEYIGEPVQKRSDGQWALFVVRKVTGPGGRFLGIIEATIELNYFERLYQDVALGSDGAVSLFRQDGILLARYPHVDPRIGKNFAPGGVFDRLKATGLDSFVAQQTGQIDGAERMIAAHTLRHYPMVVTVTTTVASILTGWRTQTAYVVVTALILELFMASVGVLMLRQLRGQRMLHEARANRAEAIAARRGAEAELVLAYQQERVSRELSIQNVRFKAALGSMSQALCMFDSADGLVIGNARLAAMFGLPAASIAPGMTFEAMRALMGAETTLEPVDLETMYNSLLRMKAEGKRTAHVRELTDGRALAVNFCPIEGDGWLVTLEDITDRRQVEARIFHMAHHDALTGLPNRVLFHDRLTEAMARSHRGEPCAVLYLDLDHFKAVNDTLGHPVGDALLREVTRRLDSQIRETDTIARLGGDEFAIVQSSANQPADATALAIRLIDTLGAPYDLDGQQVIIGTSIGIAVVPGDGDGPDQVLKHADMALYRAKADGRGRYSFFEPEMDERMQKRRTLEMDLRRALVEEEFEIYYQPLVNLKTRRLTGFEALLRWAHPQRGMVSPAEFVPFAEEIGLIVPLGEWVLRRACADAAGWPGTPKLAVNLSPMQFTSRTLVADVAAALAASGLDPARLELEITETVMLEDTEAVLVILHRLRDLGIGIAMDDFGTGYSSLSYLRRFPFSKVKIDQSFVAGLGQGGDCDTIVAAVADLCKQLGMITTAEGVETEDQLDRLAAGNCTEVQGYLFSQPRPASEVAALCLALNQPSLTVTSDCY